MRNWIPFLLSISIGFVFIVSAITKLFPIEPFEYQFVDIGLASWNTAPYIARFFISIEFLVGFLFVLNLSLRKWTIRLAAFILLVFSTYLLYKIMKEGNVGNCGCFGEVYKMTPLQGLLKNIGLFVAVIALYWSAEKIIGRVNTKNSLSFVGNRQFSIGLFH
ncbi:MAG: MauE/DoxX family redox-associated membrane protein [Chitinophagales bacterium]